MSMATCTLSSRPLLHKSGFLPPNISLHTSPRGQTTNRTLLFLSSPTATALRFFRREILTNCFPSGRNLRFCVRVENGGGDRKSGIDEAKEDEELRGQSTMPDRFRYLTKEAPDPPVRWPWFVALAFLIYAWRSVFWELGNWRKLLVGIIHFMGYLSKLVLALIFHFIGDPITYTILYIEAALHASRSFYSSIVSSAPIPELTTIIILASAVLAIAEAAVPDSVNCQPYLLTASGIIGYAAVRGFVSEPLFWIMLLGLFSFARFVKKRDCVSSALPVAALLASVGEPWVRALALISFTSLAMQYRFMNPADGKEEVEPAVSNRKPPLPLLGVALAIGIRVAAQWAGYRHLTWMIV
ncbi:hypothetical protein Nepgr_000463 [Nepenthes gracilis]|uniref:Uncharacterized protein n=1 Tax=Nepenthes gracilis TaxID=150966 RepID=A0AAD3RW90_NEPGR|nr:hypothetical protein Nepgr_000463 [Nepenthes gracilis]